MPKIQKSNVQGNEPHNGIPTNPRDKAGDIPFTHIYLGFLAGFVLVFNATVFRDLWSFSKLWSEAKLFDTSPRGRENVMLVTLASVALVPLLGAYRFAWWRLVFAPLATSWAGLPRDSVKHRKFCEQGFLAVHYLSTSVLGFYVLHDEPWWVGHVFFSPLPRSPRLNGDGKT